MRGMDECLSDSSGGHDGKGVGGVDVSLGERLAVRIIQINYNLFNMGGERPGQRLRVKTGVVFKFD
jgi:hypothetical protein